MLLRPPESVLFPQKTRIARDGDTALLLVVCHDDGDKMTETKSTDTPPSGAPPAGAALRVLYGLVSLPFGVSFALLLGAWAARLRGTTNFEGGRGYETVGIAVVLCPLLWGLCFIGYASLRSSARRLGIAILWLAAGTVLPWLSF